MQTRHPMSKDRANRQIETFHFLKGQQIVAVPFKDQSFRDLALQYYNLPCLVMPCTGHNDFRVYGYLGWKPLPKQRIPKQLRLLKILLT